ncbi:MAG: hypothetical protein JW866_11260 [Ignavibacteriales bacterium]|nr:hypothetical protein [Ignavibacteriales bacterium]
MHKKFSIILFLVVISLFSIKLLYSQNPYLFPEPKYTVGKSNRVDLKSGSYEGGSYWVFITDISESDYFAGGTSFAELFIFPPNPPADVDEIPLKHNKTYHYFFKDSNDLMSNTVESTQDTAHPVFLEVPTIMTQPTNSNWYNQKKILFSINVSDSLAGVSSVCVSKIVKLINQVTDTIQIHERIYYNEDSIDPSSADAAPPTSIININEQDFAVPIEVDSIYHLIFGAKDAAHSAKSCSSHWELDGNTCYFLDTTFILRLDRTLPSSVIIDPEQKTYIRDDSIPITFWADDSAVGIANFESGLESLYLIYKYRENPFVSYSEPAIYKTYYMPKKDAVDTTVTFKFEMGEGWYEITTIAKDSATNLQADSIWRTIIYDKTPPSVKSFGLFDFSEVATQYTSPITALHWTNDLTNRLKIKAVDSISGLKQAKLYGDIQEEQFIWNINGCNFSECERETLMTILDNDSNSIFCQLFDNTGNYIDPINWIIHYDPIKPELENFWLSDLQNITPGITNELNINVNFVLDPSEKNIHKIAFIQEDIYDDIFNTKDWDLRDNYFIDYLANRTVLPFELTNIEPFDNVGVYCVVKDSAGNVSEHKYSSIYYFPDTTFNIRTTLFDKNDFAPDSLYSDEPEVKVRIVSDIPFSLIDTVWLSQNIASLVSKDNARKFDDVTDKVNTTFIFETTQIGDANYTLYGVARNIYGRVSDTIAISNIFLDFTPPNIDRIRLSDRVTGDTTYTANLDISVTLIGDSDNCPDGIQWISLAECPDKPDFSYHNNRHQWIKESSYSFTVSEPKGRKLVCAQVMDWAEHVSVVTNCDTIFYDPTDPEKVYNAPNPFNPLSGDPEQSETKIIVKSEHTVRVNIYDIFGNLVESLDPSDSQSGYHQIVWDGRNRSDKIVADGVYIAIVHKKEGVKRIKIAVIKN